MDDSANEYLLDEYKKAEAIRRVKQAMDIIDSVFDLLDLIDVENDLRYGLSGACIDLDQIVLPQLEDGITKGKWF